MPSPHVLVGRSYFPNIQKCSLLPLTAVRNEAVQMSQIVFSTAFNCLKLGHRLCIAVLYNSCVGLLACCEFISSPTYPDFSGPVLNGLYYF